MLPSRSERLRPSTGGRSARCATRTADEAPVGRRRRGVSRRARAEEPTAGAPVISSGVRNDFTGLKPIWVLECAAEAPRPGLAAARQRVEGRSQRLHTMTGRARQLVSRCTGERAGVHQTKRRNDDE